MVLFCREKEGDYLKHGNRFKDLTGMKFGLLTVIKEYGKDKNGMTKWLCQCECGKQKIVLVNSLLSGRTQSCGSCLKSELYKYKLAQNVPNALLALNSKKEEILKEGTNLSSLHANISKSNKSGFKGICWDKSRNKWSADITFKGKRYHLGRFSNLSDAITARKAAEEKYFKPIIDKYSKGAAK